MATRVACSQARCKRISSWFELPSINIVCLRKQKLDDVDVHGSLRDQQCMSTIAPEEADKFRHNTSPIATAGVSLPPFNIY